jgi:hypothetical protein
MSPPDEEELSYHLRELHADLALIRADLEIAAAPDIDRSVIRAWIDVNAMLAHDLEVHLPRALALLGAQTPPGVGSQGESEGHAMSRILVAVEAKNLIEQALAALPAASESLSSIHKVAEAARIVQAAHYLVAKLQEVVVGGDSTT